MRFCIVLNILFSIEVAVAVAVAIAVAADVALAVVVVVGRCQVNGWLPEYLLDLK